MAACSLLTDTEAQQAVPGAGAAKDQGQLGGTGTSDCEWMKNATNDQGGVTFGITVRPSQGLDEINTDRGQATNGKSGNHLARHVTQNGACLLGIAVGNGRVDITASTIRGTTEEMCAVANKISDIIEPKLPAT
jgi:hypothetical protein